MKRNNRKVVGGKALPRLLAAACMAAFSTLATAETISICETVTLRNDTIYDAAFPLTMDGGVLSIHNKLTGGGVTVTAFDAILRNGIIANGGPQFANNLNFFGTTTVGNPTAIGPFPANGMYFSAPTESPWTFTNRGVFVQSRGDMVLMGNTTLRTFTVHYLDNDAGILGDPQKSGIPGAAFPVSIQFVGGFQGGLGGGLLNEAGATLVKRSGTGTSEIRVPVTQDSARIEVLSGTLALTNSGSHNNSFFYADPRGSNPDNVNPGNVIVFGTNNFGGGNMHVFSGINTTETGIFVLDAGVVLQVTNNPLQPSEWRQRARFLANGTIDLDGARLVNTGTLLATDITGRRVLSG